jgi:hypothetical protein
LKVVLWISSDLFRVFCPEKFVQLVWFYAVHVLKKLKDKK